MITERKVIKGSDPGHFRVAIFGSARIRKKDEVYDNIYSLAKMLGERGIDVVTGGGPGLMEAANSGHKSGSKQTKAHSIGLGIRLPREQRFNKSLDYKEKFERFTNRLDRFMLLSNAVVVSDGGVGTMLELFYTWQLVQTNKICNIPIILMGDMWIPFVDWLKKYPLKRKYFDKKDLDMLILAKNQKRVIEIIDEVYSEFKKGNRNFCVNFEKYK